MGEKVIKRAYLYRNRKIVILWVDSHYCAYGETTLKGTDYTQEFGSYETSPSFNIDAHGGVTFSGKLSITPFDKDIWYFGIDFAHAGDYCDFGADSELNHNQDKRWALEEVEKEAEKLIDGIIIYESKIDKYKELYKKFQEELQKEVKR